MDKAYDPKAVEERIYRMWEEGGYFTPTVDPKKKPFTILLPLPNANDPMHMGHALFVIQDILVRYHRMKGDPTLWLPGGDHAGIETQYVFEKHLTKEGKSRFDFDRDTLYRMIEAFVENNKTINQDQMRRLGFSLDWTRYHYSLEPEIVATVLDTFKKLYNDGLLYRDDRLVNYCTRCGTSYSDLEIIDKETQGSLYFINFQLVGGGTVMIATTRPETIVGDVAVMVNPKDKRYKSIVDKHAILPVANREVPIIADPYVNMGFGTGAVKVTPAHDHNDYEIAKKHNLAYPPIIGFDGRMQNTGVFDGMKVKAAREEMLKKLTELGLLVKTEPHEMVVKTCYRCGTTLEPLPLPQWYVKTKPLAKAAIEAVKKGKTKIVPLKRFEKMYFDWMNKILDWNISRQIVWGPRIPVWHKVDGHESRIWVSFLDKNKELRQGPIRQWYEKNITLEEINRGLQRVLVPIYEEKNQPEISIGEHPPSEGNWIRETDTFDTWFLSSQWPFTTLGFPDGKDFGYFYPTSVLDTMWDILFFWVARMMMMSIYRTGKIPFEVVHLHSRVVDAKGQKMSKSKGNVLNPIDLVEKYGADALRFTLVFGAAPGGDIAVSEDKIRGMRNFANKLWNIARFLNMSMGDRTIPFYDQSMKLTDASDRKIIKDTDVLVALVTKHIDRYRFSDAAQALYQFAWHTLADVYLEENKERIKSGDVQALAVLRHVLLTTLKLLHPFMPFVTEEIWSKMPRKYNEPLIISSWPRSTLKKS